MGKTRRWPWAAVISGAFVCMPLPSSAQSSGSGDPQLESFKFALEDAGYAVTPGLADVFNIAQAWCDRVPGVEHAWYANKANYLVLKVPPTAGELDPAKLTTYFQLAPDEAIVLIGPTPPPVKYFGFYTWVAKKVYPDGRKLETVTTVVDSINNATLTADGSTPFNRLVALIITPDRRTDARVRAALESAGYDHDAITITVGLPAPMLSFGYGTNADEFQIMLRTGIWADPGAGESYIMSAKDNLKIFRVTPPADVPCAGSDCGPFPVPRLRVRGTGETELGLWNKLSELRAGIIAKNQGLYATDIPITVPIGYEDYDCVQRGEHVGGGTRDGFFLQAGYFPEFLSWDRQITLAQDEFLMVFGANHVRTGKAAYMSVNVYTGEAEQGKLSIGGIDDRQFVTDGESTAARYLPGDPDANLMYAYKISRNCKLEPDCLEVPSADLRRDCPRLHVNSNTILGVIFRMYLEAATGVGAVMPEVLYDRVLKFSPRPPKTN